MAKVTVIYTALVVENIDWPDDEMEDFSLENLQLNIGKIDGDIREFDCEDIETVKINGIEHQF
jgi:hypothetical protein